MATEFQHCTACCRTFSTVGAADLHRKAGPGRMVRCIDPPLVRARDGRPLLVESRRSRAAGTTVTIWARADATGWRGQPTPDPQDAPRRGRVMQRAAHLPEENQP